MGEMIGFSKLLTENEISEILNLLFPKIEFKKVDYDSIIETELDLVNVGFFMYLTDSDFPIRIDILFPNREHTVEREQYIANELSLKLDCRTIVGYQEKDSANPFLNLVFENGKIFLGDDEESKYADEGENEIRIIDELDYKINWQFDEYSNKI